MKRLHYGKMANMMVAAIVAITALASCGGQSGKPKNTSTSGLIAIAVDESFQNIMNQEIDVFEYTYPNANIIPYYVDEHSAIDSMLELKTKLIITAHELKDVQKEYLRQKNGVCFSQRIAVDAIALIVNKDNPIEILSVSEIKEILLGQVTQWNELEPSKLKTIKVVFDHPGSSTARYMKDSLLCGADFGPNVYAQNSNPEVFKVVENDKNALGIIGVSWVSADMKAQSLSVEERAKNLAEENVTTTEFASTIKVLKVRPDDSIEAYKPYQAYIYDGTYPLFRSIYATCSGVGGSLPHGFYSFITGFLGQKIIQQTGVLPATIQPRMVSLN